MRAKQRITVRRCDVAVVLGLILHFIFFFCVNIHAKLHIRILLKVRRVRFFTYNLNSIILC